MSKFSFSDWFEEEISIYFERDDDADELKSYLESENINTVSQLEELDVNNLLPSLKKRSKTILIRVIKNIRGNLIYVYIFFAH